MQSLPDRPVLETKIDEHFLFEAMLVNPYLLRKEDYKYCKARILLPFLWAETEETHLIKFLEKNLLNGVVWLRRRNYKKINAFKTLFVTIRKLSIQLKVSEVFHLVLSRRMKKKLYFKKMDLIKKKNSLKKRILKLDETLDLFEDSFEKDEIKQFLSKILLKLNLKYDEFPTVDLSKGGKNTDIHLELKIIQFKY